MTGFFKEMFEYTYHFNLEIINLLKGGEIHPEKALRLLNHTLNAHEIWNTRILQKTPAVGVWDIRPFEMLESINADNYQQTLNILDSYEFDNNITYTTSRGEPFTNTIQDILFHIINHSTYHRGQIATDCKEHGITPLVSDYIFYKRL
jgi:uncharacterized damage-inducible protein DinB